MRPNMPNMAKIAKYAYLGEQKNCQMGCPWKDLAKCSSDALVLGQLGPPVKSYDQIKFLADFPIVITILNFGWVVLRNLGVYKF